MDPSVSPRSDPHLQRFVERVARDERLLERRDAHALGSLGEKPAAKIRDLVFGAVQDNEAMRVDLVAIR